ncbi:hypothetical protein Tco_0217385 [Tanacetum coccineum]
MAEIKTNTTMEESVTKDRANYYSRITSITVNGKAAYELKGKFLDNLRDHAFSGTNGEDADYYYTNQRITSITVNGKAAYELKGKFLDNLRDHAFSGTNGEDAAVVFPISLVRNAKLLGMVRVGYMTYFQDHEWYDELMDSSLKEEALKQKAIYEKSWGDSSKVDHICGPYANINTHYDPYLDGRNGNANKNYDIQEEEELHKNEERCELFDNPRQEPPICKVKRFEMIKYSFGQEEKYVVVKEYEYDDLSRTNDDACHAYQEIFRNMDEGWFLHTAYPVIMEYLVKISKKARILELKRRHLKITVLTSYTPYPSRKIRRICSIPINRGLIQAIPTSLPPPPIGEATKASNL